MKNANANVDRATAWNWLAPVGMARERRDIEERAYQFGVAVIRFCDQVGDRSSTTQHLVRQSVRAATSIGANLEEAAAGHTKADFIAKAAIALKEAREAHYWLRLMAGARPATRVHVERMVTEANELVAILTTIVKNARSTPNRGG